MAGKPKLAVRSALVMMSVLVLASVLSASASAASSPHPARVSACGLLNRPGFDTAVGRALRMKVATYQANHNHGFSECLFVSRKGTFVDLYAATTQMLSWYAGHRVWASSEFDLLNQPGGFPHALQYINHSPEQLLVLVTWQAGLNDGVVAVASFGYFHKIDGHDVTFPHATSRLTAFMNKYVMPSF